MTERIPTTAIPLPSVLGGALCRRIDGQWYWTDVGEPEPRISDLLLRDVAPNFRCVTYGSGTVVKIPHDWCNPKYWPCGRADEDAVMAIAGMIANRTARAGLIYAEGLAELADDHRMVKHGYTLPIAAWDVVMGAVVGATWDKVHEAALLDRAARF